MWFFIFAGMYLAVVLGMVYLTCRISTFEFIKKLAKGKRIFRFLLASIPVILGFVLVCLLIDGTNALICYIHLACIWLMTDLAILIVTKIRKKAFRTYLGWVAIPIAIVYLSMGWFLAHHVWIKEYNINTEKQVEALRVVFLADSHVGTTFDGDGFAKQVERIQELKPDAVMVIGDYIDDDTSKEDMLGACEALGTLQTTYGVYYVYGNHDRGYYSAERRGYGPEELAMALTSNGVTILEDETVMLGDSYYLIGRKDRSAEGRGGRASMQQLVQALDPSKYTIVLDHQPHDFDNQAEAGVDLVLSGHTHAGQLLPINFMGEWTNENDMTYGLRTIDSTNFITTSGISAWSIKFKTGCNSEFVVVDINKKLILFILC